MKRLFCWTLLLIVLCTFSMGQAMAHDKVVVVPLNSSNKALTGDQYYTVSFADFVPGAESNDYSHGWFFASLGFLKVNSGALVLFNAPVNLPDGSTVSEISLAAADDSNGDTVTIWFEKLNITTNTVGFIPDQSGIDTAGLAEGEYALQSLAVNEVIDNKNNQYFIYAYFAGGPSDRLMAVRLKYTYKQ